MFYIEEEIGYGKCSRRTGPVETQYSTMNSFVSLLKPSALDIERNISWQTVNKFKGRGINETALFRFSYSRLVSPRRIHLFRSARQTTSCPASGRKCSSPDVADAHQQSDVTPTLFQLHCWRVYLISASLYFNRLLNGITAAQTFKNHFVTIIIRLFWLKILTNYRRLLIKPH